MTRNKRGFDKRQRAIFDILNRVVEGADSLIWSEVLTFENSRHPKPDRRQEIGLWQERAVENVPASSEVERRAQTISAMGIGPLDVAHLACAEAGAAEVFLTCDGELIKRAQHLGLNFRVLNPVDYWMEVSRHG
jgi:predicted nucleic acid-binding protein